KGAIGPCHWIDYLIGDLAVGRRSESCSNTRGAWRPIRRHCCVDRDEPQIAMPHARRRLDANIVSIAIKLPDSAFRMIDASTLWRVRTTAWYKRFDLIEAAISRCGA